MFGLRLSGLKYLDGPIFRAFIHHQNFWTMKKTFRIDGMTVEVFIEPIFRRGWGVYWEYVAANEYPSHPLGFWHHGELKQNPGRHLGKRVPFSSLPQAVQDTYNREYELDTRPQRVYAIKEQPGGGVAVAVDFRQTSPLTCVCSVLWLTDLGDFCGHDRFVGRRSVGLRGKREYWGRLMPPVRAHVIQWLKNNPIHNF